jgi:chemotaxis protein histidine kinase CheA
MPSSELEIVLKTSGLGDDSALAISSAMTPFFTQAEEWKAKIVAVTDPKVAKASRLVLKKIRVEAGHKKDELKEGVLKVGKTIDAAFRLIEGTISPMEETLEGIEKAAERAEAARIAKIKSDREAALAPFSVVTTFFDLANMPEEVFAALLADKKAAHEAKVAAENKALQDRIAKEKADAEERERVRLENIRLKEEAKAREEVARLEREKAAKEKAEAEFAAKIAAEASRKERAAIEAKAAQEKREIEAQAQAAAQAASAKAKKEREQAEAVARKEREARQALEEENRKREAAQQAKEAAEREAARKAQLAPDREKLMALAEKLLEFPLPECESSNGQAMVKTIKTALIDLHTSLKHHASLL